MRSRAREWGADDARRKAAGNEKKDIFEAVFPLGGDAGEGTRATSARRVGMGNNDTPWDHATRVDGWMR